MNTLKLIFLPKLRYLVTRGSQLYLGDAEVNEANID